MLKTFTVAEKRSRYVDLLASTKGRAKVLKTLDHFKDLEPVRCQPVSPGDQRPEGIAQLLKGLGAPDACYLFSSNPMIDGRELALEEALREIVWYSYGTFLCCIPGRLAYFEGEQLGERFICSNFK